MNYFARSKGESATPVETRLCIYVFLDLFVAFLPQGARPDGDFCIFIGLKKGLAIALVSIILLQSGVFFLFQKYQQYKVKQKMAIRLSESFRKFEKLSLSLDAYKAALIDKNEIYYEGRYYDIKNLRIKGNTVELTALCDFEEQNLVAKMNLFAQMKHGSADKNKSTLLPFFVLLHYVFPHIEMKFNLACKESLILPDYTCALASIPGEIQVPPPRKA